MRLERAFYSRFSPRQTQAGHRRIFLIHTALQIGKYLVSPLARRLRGGRFGAAVSIRSGAGSMTHDRVMRFVPAFDSRDAANRFATEQALAWIGQRSSAVVPSTSP